jgi:cytochrome b561
MANWRNSASRWGNTARLFHWLIAALIICLFIVGLVMEDIEGAPNKFFVYAIHKSMGLLALALIICRIVWRLADKAPPALSGIPRLQRLAAALAHWGLYVLMIAVPVSGWVMHSLSGYQTHWFGQPALPVLPTIVEVNRRLADGMGELHGLLAWGLIVLALIHAGAGLYHHFIRKDATLARMTPFVKEP